MTLSFLMESCAKVTPIGYTKSQQLHGYTAISEEKRKTYAKNEFRELEKPNLPKIKIVAKCCRMLQDVASHYVSELECLKTLRTTALKSPSRNYPKKSKYKFETKIHSCNVASPSVSCKTWNTLSRCINPPAGARVEMALAKKATLLQTTPRWNQQTLTSVVNGVVPW